MKNALLILLAMLPMLTACSQNDASSAKLISQNQISVKTVSQKQAGWDADAGVIPSLTIGATVTASSNSDQAHKVLDEKKESHWQSGQPFPNDFFGRADQNFLVGHFNQTKNYRASKITQAKYISDGDIGGEAANIQMASGEAFVEVLLQKPKDIKSIAIRAGNVKEGLEVFIKKNNQLESVGVFEEDKNYQVKRFSVQATQVNAILIKSKNPFLLWEIAALDSAPKEWVKIDLGKVEKVGWIDTRHWAGQNGSAVSSALLTSVDGKTWTKIKDLDPTALQTVSTIISPPVTARYIKVEHGLAEKDYGSVFIWEIDAYDENGPYGKMPTAKMNPNTFSDILGVNGIWGWGFEKYADEVPRGRGADLFEKISSHARNYHFMIWDILDPDTPPDYRKMAAGKGTNANWWLDWDREYKKWTEDGMKLQTSIQFRDIPKDQWNTPYESAYKFGYNFAQHFGPTNGNGMVDAVEAGNEPWYYEADFYKKILHGMTKGIKEGDPKITVLPCALQAAFPANEYEGEFKNYMGARVTPEVKNYIDAINTHLTPWSYNEAGVQIATHPEHPYNGTRAILNVIRFRNQNLPRLPIYVSEWGWDSAGGTEKCTHGECVSERAQALYAVRGALMLARTGIDRATWYFYANENKESSLFTRSGLVSSLSTDFKIKKSFIAWQAFLHHLGDKHFLKVIQENERAWIYAVGDKNGKTTHLVAWRPIDAEDNSTAIIEFPSKYTPKAAWKLEGKNKQGESTAIPNFQNGKIKMEVSVVPVVVQVE